MTIVMLFFLFLHLSAVCTVYHNGTKVFLKSNLDFHTLISQGSFYAFNFSKQVPADSHNFRFRLYQGLHIKNLSNCCSMQYGR